MRARSKSRRELVFDHKVQKQDFRGSRACVGKWGEGFTACPVATEEGVMAFECVNLKTDVKRCGGCAAETGARDCSSIPGVNDVECAAGTCVVNSCNQDLGFTLSANGHECVLTVVE
ncbi:hypothetical protein T439DRAFT_112788 [Meredithblackwellia eburnea MCA 4105]